jgi:hypothetical protein
MDIQKALSELYEEKKRLDWTISTLEARLKISPFQSRGRRGRKSMGDDERLKVSERMSAYWAGRRAAKRVAQAATLQSTAQSPAQSTAQPPVEAVQETFPLFEQPVSSPPVPGIPVQNTALQSVQTQSVPAQSLPAQSAPSSQSMEDSRLSA